MKRLCALVCNNGLGHFRRTLQVVAGLLAESNNVSLEIVCAPWQIDAMSGWQTLQAVRSDNRVTFQCLETYSWWSSRRDASRKEHLLTWHEQLGQLKLDSYDLVLSDNLVEALIYQPRTILMGSFLWHDVYAARFADDPVVQRYRNGCLELLQKFNPPIIVNRYFAMPEIGSLSHTVRVGMLPAVVKHGLRHSNGHLGVFFIGGSNQRVTELLRPFLLDILGAKLLPEHIRLFVDRPLAQQLPALDDLKVFDYDADDFDQIDAVVARPGMGVITDCIGTGVPLYCLYEPNSELEHNAQVLERLHLGRSLNSLHECLDQISTFFADPQARQQYESCIAGIDKSGLEQTVGTLISHLN